MAKKRYKILKITLIVILSCLSLGFFINWFLAYRLESKLNDILSKEVSKATGGFYTFSFEELSIGLFNGELSIRGIDFKPDSTVYSRWERADSLPDTYYKIKVGEIHFKGLNLIWMRNYTKLNFSLFEITSPDVNVFGLPSISSEQSQPKRREAQTLYELVSPYIDVLSVDRINLRNANVSYTLEDPDSPIIYALKEADFKAYKFRLDENSSISGNLLYCDDFEFVADKSQQLLYSNQLILGTDNIKLSTLESLIKIEGVRLHPTEEFWNNRTSQSGNYLNAAINGVEVKGVSFKREQGKNYLIADSFDILSTDIQYYSVLDSKQDDKGNDIEEINDTIKEPKRWSLYSIVSPILNSISIDKVNIEKTKFDYSITQDKATDTYVLSEFDFHANKFFIDSVSERYKKFWYVDNFVLTGTDIEGNIESNNSIASVSSLYLDTQNKCLNIRDINIKPLSTNTTKDYIIGSVDSLNIEGLDYGAGIDAKRLGIYNPVIEYYRVSQPRNVQSSSKNNIQKTETFLDYLYPYAEYLSVKNIDLKEADLAYNDIVNKNTYSIHHLNFWASNFLMNEQTREEEKYLFAFDDAGLSFTDFDNITPDKKHRIQIAETDISTLDGVIRFKDVKLNPLNSGGIKNNGTSYDLDLELFEMKGFDYRLFFKNSEKISMKSLTMLSPYLKVFYSNPSNKIKNNKGESQLIAFFDRFKIDSLNVSNAKLVYANESNEDSLSFQLSNFSLDKIDWTLSKKFGINKLILDSLSVYSLNKKGDTTYQVEKPSSLASTLSPFMSSINIGQMAINAVSFYREQPSKSLDVNFNAFELDQLDIDLSGQQSSLALNKFYLNSPSVTIKEQYNSSEPTKVKVNNNSGDFWSMLSSYFATGSVGEFDILSANISYDHSLNGKLIKHQKFNETSIGFSGLTFNALDRQFNVADISLYTKDLYFPINNGFYTLGIKEIDLSKKNKYFSLSDVRMIPAYSKLAFAYNHPTHRDWFNVSAGKVVLSGLDFDSYFKQNTLKASKLDLQDVVLENFKNQKVTIEHNVMPLIYEKLYELPIRLDIDKADVQNFNVVYEELPREGSYMGRILFEKMNSKIYGLTNIVSDPNQYIRLDINGIFMRDGHFKARWEIPVNPENDCFILSAHIKDFDLKGLNEIFTPLAKARLKNGFLSDFRFKTEASSLGARAKMLFIYNDLRVDVLREADDNNSQNKLLTTLVNTIIKSNNPNRTSSTPRYSEVEMVRDPYHSTFNYFWQILQPPLIESAGISESTQNTLRGISGFLNKVKSFFSGNKHDKKGNEKN